MKQVALGQLLYTPAQFGRMLLGDFLDAYLGHVRGNNKLFKGIAELLRRSTTILWNKQIGEKNVLKAEDLWPFPWDNERESGGDIPSLEAREEMQKVWDFQAALLEKT